MSVVHDMPFPASESTQAKATSRPHLLTWLSIITVIAVFVGLYFALFYAGTDETQGQVQRIFYIHVSSFSGAAVSFFCTVIAGIMYLRTRSSKWDTLAVAGVEVGFALSLMNLTTGMIWAYPIWGDWWTWDPRLISAAVMVLTYAAYLMLRNGIENPETRRRFAAVYGILAFTTVVITYIITRIEPRTIHPVVIGPSPQNPNAEGAFGLTPSMRTTLAINSFIWSVFVPWTLIWFRIRLQNVADYVRVMKANILSEHTS